MYFEMPLLKCSNTVDVLSGIFSVDDQRAVHIEISKLFFFKWHAIG